MAIVDILFYQNRYRGKQATECEFEAMESLAEDIVGSMTRWRVTEDTIASFPGAVQLLYKKAICAQVDFLAINGVDSVTGGSGTGFTVGRVTVSGGQTGEGKGGMAAHVSPLVGMYLEQTGLLAPQVPTGLDMPIGWWWF